MHKTAMFLSLESLELNSKLSAHRVVGSAFNKAKGTLTLNLASF